MNLVLIGYRGTGKTGVGQRLADRLDRPFYDTDTLVEAGEQMTITDMVKTHGWPFFRSKERAVIKALPQESASVIATGGGAVMDRRNVSHLRKNGVFVLLTADLDVLVQRVLADQGSAEKRPPLLQGNLHEEMATVLKDRMPTYLALAQVSVDTTHLTIDDVVKKTIQILEAEKDRFGPL
jgi:shikimate kinase